ncbi:MAG: hypothetical protein RIS70_4115, partial [Planctomycetota bacterium]
MSGGLSMSNLNEWIGDLTWLWLGLVATWFIAIAAWKRIYPYYSLLILALVPCILAAGLFLWPSLALVVLITDAAVALTMLVDLRSLPKAADFVVRRELLKVASIQKNHRVTLVLSNQSSRSRLVWIRDDIPQDFTAEPEQAAIAMTP